MFLQKIEKSACQYKKLVYSCKQCIMHRKYVKYIAFHHNVYKIFSIWILTYFILVVLKLICCVGIDIKFAIVRSFQGNKEDEILILDESFDVFVYEEESQKIVLSMI